MTAKDMRTRALMLVMTLSMEDEVFMERAYELAEEALRNNEVPVGCVFVHKGKEIGCGRNKVNETRDPTTHAEMVAIRRMQSEIPLIKDILPELELFVSLEPCIMCACAMYELGIKRIVYGARNDRFGGICSVGNREKYGFDKDIETTGDIQSARSIALLKQFYEKQNPFAPEDKVKVKRKKD